MIDREDYVYDYCKQNNIQVYWDFDKKTGERWNVISLDNNPVFQIDQGITKEQFFLLIKAFIQDFNTTEIKDDGIDYKVWVTPDEELFKQFINKYFNTL